MGAIKYDNSHRQNKVIAELINHLKDQMSDQLSPNSETDIYGDVYDANDEAMMEHLVSFIKGNYGIDIDDESLLAALIGANIAGCALLIIDESPRAGNYA